MPKMPSLILAVKVVPRSPLTLKSRATGALGLGMERRLVSATLSTQKEPLVPSPAALKSRTWMPLRSNLPFCSASGGW